MDQSLLARGSADGHRLNRRMWLRADRVSGSLRLESIESKQPFTFIVKDVFQRRTDIGWTLFSPQANWVVRGEDSREVIETIVGPAVPRTSAATSPRNVSGPR